MNGELYLGCVLMHVVLPIFRRSLQKPLGLLSLLDQESTLPKSTGLTFANKLREHLKGNSCFKSERDVEFKVAHYAREVRWRIASKRYLDLKSFTILVHSL